MTFAAVVCDADDPCSVNTACDPESSFTLTSEICTFEILALIAGLYEGFDVWARDCACGLSYPQPPDRSPHGCTIGIDRDPPV